MATPEPPPERHEGGLWCHEVMDLLPDFVDDTLTEAQAQALHAHLAACDWCTRFGGHYAGTVTVLRERLSRPEPIPDDVADRLARALDRAG